MKRFLSVSILLLTSFGLFAQNHQLRSQLIPTEKATTKKLKKKKNELKHQRFITNEFPAYKKAQGNLDSIETYHYTLVNNQVADSVLRGVRYFKYNGKQNLIDDVAYFVSGSDKSGNERMSYEYKTANSYGEITYLWDDWDKMWIKDELTELSYEVLGSDTLVYRSIYYWDIIDEEWAGRESISYIRYQLNKNYSEVNEQYVWNMTTKSWDNSIKDSVHYNEFGHETYSHELVFNNNAWETDEELRFSLEYDNQLLYKVTTERNDGGTFKLLDSTVIENPGDTLGQIINFYNEFEPGEFGLRSQIVGNYSNGKTQFTRLYNTKDSIDGELYTEQTSIYYLNNNGELIGEEHFDNVSDYGISKFDYLTEDTLYSEIEYTWDFANDKWLSKEKNSFVANSQNYYTYNAYYTWDKAQNEWVGINLRIYYFDADDETLLRLISYNWNKNNKDWDYKEDERYERDADEDIIYIHYRLYDTQVSSWIPNKIDIFYYGGLGTQIAENNTNKINIFPNPASEWVSLSSNKTAQFINIYNMNGSLLSTVKNQNIINIASLPKGTYIIEAKIENQLVTNQLIKK